MGNIFSPNKVDSKTGMGGELTTLTGIDRQYLMPNYAEEIDEVLGAAPADLVEFYEKTELPLYPRNGNILAFEDAKRDSVSMLSYLICDSLGAWILNDDNDSNPYLYVTRGPCKGCIFHLSHDGESYFAFSSLKSFIEAVHAVQGAVDEDEEEVAFYELEREIFQLDLGDFVHDLIKKGDEQARLYLRITSHLSGETKELFVSSIDFFDREEIALYFLENPSREDLHFAQKLAKDTYAQVSGPAKMAVEGILEL